MIASAAALQMPDFAGTYLAFVLFFILIVIAIAYRVAKTISNQSVQRPVLADTAFPPPPPPDTVMVKCQYCGTQQIWKETCVQCGAPLPKPEIGREMA